ncbi:hypothetical protein C5167_017701 [Papaver somniferum]|uniref:Transmembrane protein n=1 Tax=Papaver somniferum TaxID=3469 RepID=A0A4Y7IK54_PAPSO|nr:hypothetical protein C5167_017701 [Papaver somniferum]
MDGSSFIVVMRLVVVIAAFGAGGIVVVEVGGCWIGVGLVLLLGWFQFHFCKFHFFYVCLKSW